MEKNERNRAWFMTHLTTTLGVSHANSSQGTNSWATVNIYGSISKGCGQKVTSHENNFVTVTPCNVRI